MSGQRSGRVLVLGSLNVDLVTRVERHPNPGETVSGEGLQQLASQAAERAQQAAVRAQPYASATLWSTLAAMLLALLAAIAGAMTGRRQVVRKLDETVGYRSRP